MTTGLETYMGDQFVQIIGDPMMAGLLILAFFGVISFFVAPKLDGKLVILVPGLILASIYIPFLYLLVMIGAGGVLSYGLLKFFQR